MSNNSLTNDLNNKAQLWGLVNDENDLGEIARKPGKIKDIVYCNILPAGYSLKDTPITTRNEHTHKFKCRLKSIPNPKLDMFFVHDGSKYEFLSWDIDFKNREYINIFTKLVME